MHICNTGQTSSWGLPAELYMNEIDEDATVKIWIAAKVSETDQLFFDDVTIDVDKPDLVLEVTGCSQ